MAIEFYEITDTKRVNRLFKIDHVDFDMLEKTLIDFKELTGVNFDAYGSTWLYKTHIDIIVNLLRRELAEIYVQD